MDSRTLNQFFLKAILICTFIIQGQVAFSKNCEVPSSKRVLSRHSDGSSLNLSIKHFENDGVPVILQHGVLANDRHFDLDFKNQKGESLSFARFLCNQGFDVYVTNFRGTGTNGFESEMPQKRWSIDDYVLEDFPSFVKFVREKRNEKPFLIGHSLGGWAIASYLQGIYKNSNNEILVNKNLAEARNASIRGSVLLSPVLSLTWEKYLPEIMSDALHGKLISENENWNINPAFEILATKPFQMAVLKFGLIDPKILEKIGTMPISEIPVVGSILNKIYEPTIHGILTSTNLFGLLWYSPNVNTEALHFALKDFIGVITGEVFYQFQISIEAKTLKSFDGKFEYMKNLDNFSSPTLIFSGDKDLLVNHKGLYNYAKKIGSNDKTFIDLKNYGHLDYFLGVNLKQDVQLPMLNWLIKH